MLSALKEMIKSSVDLADSEVMRYKLTLNLN